MCLTRICASPGQRLARGQVCFVEIGLFLGHRAEVLIPLCCVGGDSETTEQQVSPASFFIWRHLTAHPSQVHILILWSLAKLLSADLCFLEVRIIGHGERGGSRLWLQPCSEGKSLIHGWTRPKGGCWICYHTSQGGVSSGRKYIDSGSLEPAYISPWDVRSPWFSHAKIPRLIPTASLTDCCPSGTHLDSVFPVFPVQFCQSWKHHHFVKIVPCLTIHAAQYPDHTACASQDEADHTQAPFDVPSLWSHKSTLLPDPFKPDCWCYSCLFPFLPPLPAQNSISRG